MRFLTDEGAELHIDSAVMCPEIGLGIVTGLDDYVEGPDANGDGLCYPKLTVTFKNGATDVFEAHPNGRDEDDWIVEDLV